MRGSQRRTNRRAASIPSRRAFVARLFFTFLAALVLVEVGLYAYQSAEMRRLVMADGADRQVERGQVLMDAYGSAAPGADPWTEVRRVLVQVRRDPEVRVAMVISPTGRVVVADQAGLEGVPHGGAQIAQVIRSGQPALATDSYRGREVFEYISRVQLGGGPYVFEVEEDPLVLARELTTLRLSALTVLAVGVLVAIPLLYVLGGRALASRFGAAKDQAALDGMTGLHNHWSFQDSLDLEIARAERFETEFTLVLVDVDDFKRVNDSRGHRAGDEVLISLADALTTGGRSVDRAYRIGGDEFAVVMPHTGRDDAVRAVEHLQTEARRRMSGPTVSMGMSVFEPAGDRDASTLTAGAADLRDRADQALYEAKRRGGDQVVAFAEVARSAPAGPSPAAIAAVRRLLETRELGASFQPIWNLDTRRVLGFEGFARPHQDLALPGPLDAFAAAAVLGRVDELDALCRETILAAARDLPAGILLFLNVAPDVFAHDGETGQRLAHEVHFVGLRPEQVVVELPDTAVKHLDLARGMVQELRDLGFHLAFDRVGAGDRALGLLTIVRPEFVKVDWAVTRRASEDAAVRAVWAAVIAYAAVSGEVVIAQRVQTQKLLELVCAERSSGDSARFLGAQGYLLGRPSADPLWRSPARMGWPLPAR